MTAKRFGAVTPTAFDGSNYQLLGTVDVTAVLSVIAANKGNIDALVTIYIEPFNAPGNPNEYSYLCKDLTLSVGQSFETFRVAADVGDKIFVAASTDDVNFNSTGVYQKVGKSNITYATNSPAFPDLGDIWIDSNTDEIYAYTGSTFASVASAAPVGPTGPTGSQGVEGPTGPTGPEGFGVQVLGRYLDLETLEADNAVGAVGQAYVVVDDLYIWSDLNQEWQNVGKFSGDPGVTGPQGPIGPVGPTGETGPTGATGATGDADIYTPEETLNWSDPAPTTIAQALDELASRVTALEP